MRQPTDLFQDSIAQAAVRYGLQGLQCLKSSPHSTVVAGLLGANPIILKISDDLPSMGREAHALQCFAGHGAVKVRVAESGMLLLERAVPGTSLKDFFPIHEQASLAIACAVIKKLHQAQIPETHNFPDISQWLAVLDKNWQIPQVYLDCARALRNHLLKTSGPHVLLHGDLHHDNIVQNGENWLVIDPKGVIGESAYEVAAFVRNPIPELLGHSDARNIIHHRILCLSEFLQLPTQRIHDWCVVQAVLTWIWAIEDGCDTRSFERLANLFNQ